MARGSSGLYEFCALEPACRILMFIFILYCTILYVILYYVIP